MQNSLAAASLALAAVATAGAGWALIENQKLRTQLQERSLLPAPGENPLASPAPGERAALPPTEIARRLEAIDQRLERVNDTVAVHDRQVHELAATMDVRRATEAESGAAPRDGDVRATGISDPAQIAALIKKQVAAEVKAGKVKERKKPSVDAVAICCRVDPVFRNNENIKRFERCERCPSSDRV